MRNPFQCLCLVTCAAVATSGIARGADDRLLVVVESAPGLSVDAADVRRAIGAELGVSVVAPTDAAARQASNVLIVAVDRRDIRMSLRGSAAGLVTRTIPAPLDRPGRLREIGWLAGNLARDQVSGIISLPVDSPSKEKEVAVADAAVPAPSEPQRSPAPQPVSPPPVAFSEPVASVSARSAESGPAGPLWAVTVAGGPIAPANTFSVRRPAAGRANGLLEPVYALEVERRATSDSPILGAVLDVGGPLVVGLAVLAGSGWYHRSWFLETAVGVGLEVARRESATATTVYSSMGTMNNVTVASADQLDLYARAHASVGLAVSASLDLVGRLGVHLASADWHNLDFISATVGLRYRLP